MADAYANVVVGSKLKLKGASKKKKKNNKSKELVSLSGSMKAEEEESALTEAERKYKRRRAEKEKEEIKKEVKTSHREKVERLNAKLANLTEHNDIPRISAAGKAEKATQSGVLCVLHANEVPSREVWSTTTTTTGL
eukprot:CAMPEP_0197403562 /NCGR_PEP_ID=MMETSP1165-20131217/21710_1 /TAXON_ID=284809 /ORGANISM="Chrysocystis fragilis, Strain CCMP3189" /LENGTH=136 /DNA_ID=CAMNT_0042929781 /DNA_START=37 /DNA_END=445 /DNA_ORIENTATION=+